MSKERRARQSAKSWIATEELRMVPATARKRVAVRAYIAEGNGRKGRGE